jgi:hypothetical protein
LERAWREVGRATEGGGVGDGLEGVLAVELHDGHEGIVSVGGLVAKEGVEAADDVGCHGAHRHGAVAEEEDVGLRGGLLGRRWP